MKQVFVVCAILLMVCATQAQTPPKPQPAVAQPSAAQKARIQDLARVANLKAQEAKMAQDQLMIEVLSTLAELGLKPSETSLTFNEKGEPVFQRVETAKAPPPATTPAKTEAKP
jgi:hypothetical protein